MRQRLHDDDLKVLHNALVNAFTWRFCSLNHLREAIASAV
jgi:hypothetical protein